jgi:hypothetical protein
MAGSAWRRCWPTTCARLWVAGYAMLGVAVAAIGMLAVSA